MSLENVFPQLSERLRRLRDTVAALRLTVVEDKPILGDVALIDLRSDAIDDVIGWVDEATAASLRGHKAVRPPVRIDAARLALTQCQKAVNALSHRFRIDLVSYDRIAEVIGLARERGRDWHAWAASVQEALRQCEQPLHDLNEALFAGWQEISARAGASSVSVRTTSIGQNVTMPAPQQVSP